MNVGYGTNIGAAVAAANKEMSPEDCLIVITDEQAHDNVPEPKCGHAYMVNVGSYENGVGHGRWTRITGWSDQILRYIQEVEGEGPSPQEERAAA